MQKVTTVAQYIALYPKDVQKKLREMRATIKALAPDAQEGIKYGMPAFSYKRILVIYGAFKHHIGFYPTPSGLKQFEKDLAKYKNAKGSVQFPLERPLPLPLIRKITKFRIKESKEENKKWKS